MQRGIAVHVRYLGPTNYRGSRWVATADHPIGRAVVPYDDHAARSGIENAQGAAEALIGRWTRDDASTPGVSPSVIAAGGHMPDGSYVFIVTHGQD